MTRDRSSMGAPAEGAMLAFLYSISEAAEGYTEEKTRSYEFFYLSAVVVPAVLWLDRRPRPLGFFLAVFVRNSVHGFDVYQHSGWRTASM